MGKETRLDIIGQTFGFLKVLGITDERKRGSILYECECLSCGRKTKAISAVLLNGSKKTCGSHACIRNARAKFAEAELGYPAMVDCNGYVGDYECSILYEMLCQTKGRCKFYKSKEKT